MKVLISVDMEGIAGVTKRSWVSRGEEGYAKAALLMTQETQNAVDACKEAGVDEIFVVDGHGDGKNIDGSLLTDCVVLEKDHKGMLTGIEQVDALIMIGYHGMAGVKDSFCAHTNSTAWIKKVQIGEQIVNEGVMNALVALSMEKKVLFFSGTDFGVEEFKEVFPDVSCAVALESISFDEANTKDIKEHYVLCKEHIISSLADNKATQQLEVNEPFIVELNKPYLGVVPGRVVRESDSCFIIKENNLFSSYLMYRELLSLAQHS